MKTTELSKTATRTCRQQTHRTSHFVSLIYTTFKCLTLCSISLLWSEITQILWISYRHLPSASNALMTEDTKFTISPDLGINLIPLRLIRVSLLSTNTKSIFMDQSWKMPSSLSSKLVLFQNKRSFPLKLRPLHASAFICPSYCHWNHRELHAEGCSLQHWHFILHTVEAQSCKHWNMWVQLDFLHHMSEFFYTGGPEISENSRIKVIRLQ